MDGELIAYSSATSNAKSLYDGGGFYSIETSYHDQQFLVEELYCPKPECHCNKVHFIEMKAKDKNDGPVQQEQENKPKRPPNRYLWAMLLARIYNLFPGEKKIIF